jgi:hypothetical protein
MPTQKRGRRDEKRRPPDPRQHPGRNRQQPSVGWPKCRPPYLTPQDRQLVAQYDDFKFLELSRPEQQEDKLQNALKRDVKNRQDHDASDT